MKIASKKTGLLIGIISGFTFLIAFFIGLGTTVSKELIFTACITICIITPLILSTSNASVKELCKKD